MKRLFYLLFAFSIYLFAETNATVQESNSSASEVLDSNKSSLDDITNEKLQVLREELVNFSKDNINIDNEWTKTYSTFAQRKELIDKEMALAKQIKELESIKETTEYKKKKLKKLKNEYKIIVDKLNLLSSFENDPFKKLIEPPSLDDAPKINNPISLIGALSYIKDLDIKIEKYEKKGESLTNTIKALNKQKHY